MTTYTADTTAEEVASDCRAQIANKTILVTGASPSGLGASFATIAAKYGPACIILATRDLAKARETAAQIAAAAPEVRTHAVELDLASLSRVRAAAERIAALGEEIDVLVNNAGVMAAPYATTEDGIESQFATNHVGHFLLTNLLLPKMLERGGGGGGRSVVRVVNVASNGFRFGPVRLEDWNFDDGNVYDRWASYAQSKSANMLFSVGLAQKLGNRGVISMSLHPGVIVTTQLSRSIAMEDFAELDVLDKKLGNRSYLAKPFRFKEPSQGIATHMFAAFHPSLESPEYNGSYLQDCQVENVEHIQSWARDSVYARQLWTLSETLVGQKFEY
ncbi:dehydrogenase [Xylariales sp. PMI_506]|nr:dehydrogenase [Xylariales sp. PMI_506]